MDLAHYYFTINPFGLTGAEATKYVRDVHEHLRWVHRTKSGRMLLNVIRRPEFPIEIRPYPDAKCNAFGGKHRPNSSSPWTGLIKYTPFTFSHGGSCANTMPTTENRGRLWDEILFHELVHVFRSATGKWDTTPALSFNMRQYDDNEEFIAVLCTNIYVSDRTNKIKSGLRAGHQGFKPMSADDAARFGLFASSAKAFSLVKAFCEQNPIFTKALSEKLGDVVYNPIADYYRYPEVCEAFSYLGGVKDMTARIKALTDIGIPQPLAVKIVTMFP
jgi:hypothetical protein